MRKQSCIATLVFAAILSIFGTGCPEVNNGCGECIELAEVIVGTWELHQGGTITFDANGSFETSEGSEGEYQIVNQSVLLDIDSIEGELNQLLSYVGELPDGRLLFSQETPLGMSPTNR